jgi:hypothetical protein
MRLHPGSRLRKDKRSPVSVGRHAGREWRLLRFWRLAVLMMDIEAQRLGMAGRSCLDVNVLI